MSDLMRPAAPSPDAGPDLPMPPPESVAPPGMQMPAPEDDGRKTDPMGYPAVGPPALTPPYPTRIPLDDVAAVDVPMNDLATPPETRQKDRNVVITVTGNALFPFDTSDLRESGKVILAGIAETLKARTDGGRIEIAGHTDTEGLDEINRPLSLDRANTVRDHLVSLGLDPARITTLGLGSSRPLADNSVPENRPRNRRVEITLFPVDAPGTDAPSDSKTP